MTEVQRPMLYAMGIATLLLVFTIYFSGLVFLSFGSGLSPYGWALTAVLYLLGLKLVSKKYSVAIGKLASVSLLIFFGSALISSVWYDTSWDGQWYHYDGVYRLVHGWNPFRTMSEGAANAVLGQNARILIYYAKFPWIYSASVAQLFHGNVEAGKNLGIMLGFATLLVTLGWFTRRAEGRLQRACWILLVFVPVSITQAISFYCDSSLAHTLLLAICFGYGILKFGVKSEFLVPWVMSALMAINVKNFSIVYLLVGLLGLIAFFYQTKRENVAGSVKVFFATLMTGLFLFGFNPYFTNLKLGQFVLYPIEISWLSKEAPPIGQPFSEELKSSNRLSKFAISIFGRSNPALFESVEGLKVPFSISRSEIQGAGYYDARSGGFGPFFSGFLLVALVLCFFSFVQRRNLRMPLALMVSVVGVMVVLNPESWWARWSPEVWWLPWGIFIVVLPSASTFIRKLIFTMMVIGFLNMGVVTYGWAKRIYREQMELNSRFDELAKSEGKVKIVFDLHESLKFRLIDRGILFIEANPPIPCGGEKRFFPNARSRYCLLRDMTQ